MGTWSHWGKNYLPQLAVVEDRGSTTARTFMEVLYFQLFHSLYDCISFWPGGHLLAQICTQKLFQSQEYCVKHMQKHFHRRVTLYIALQLPSFSECEAVEGKQLPTLLLMEKIFQGSNSQPFFFSFPFFLMWKPENPFQRRSGSGWNLLTIRLLLIGLFADFPTVVPLSSPSRLSRTMGWKTSYWS